MTRGQESDDASTDDESSQLTLGPSWVTQALRERIPCARVLIYNHGKPKEDDNLDSLATKLLEHILAERRDDVSGTY